MRVDDLSGTDAKVVTWELAPFRGTTATDGAPDSVLVNGTFGNDNIKVGAGGQQVRLTGLAAAVEINRSDPSLDPCTSTRNRGPTWSASNRRPAT
jgi:hypothetical protein